jgi:hypothetical protein
LSCIRAVHTRVRGITTTAAGDAGGIAGVAYVLGVDCEPWRLFLQRWDGLEFVALAFRGGKKLKLGTA